MDKKGLLRLAKTVITTFGENGSLISTSQSDRRIPAVKTLAVVDPTGAGDAYRAGLLKGLVMGKSIETSAQMGSLAAAYAVEKYGTQEHHYSFNDFMQRYKENFGEL